MLEQIRSLLNAGKVSRAGAILARNAGEISCKEFNELNRMIKNHPVKKTKFNSTPFKRCRGKKPGNGHQ